MAIKLEQAKNLPQGDYRDMLYWSEGTFALSPDAKDPLDPFNADSTPEEIEEKLQKLHDEVTTKGFAISGKIESLLQNRMARLEKMSAYIDVEASLHSLTRGFIRDLYNDFSTHIDGFISSLPTPLRYLGNYDKVNSQLLEANYAFDGAIDALADASVLIDAQAKLNKKKIAYTALHRITDFWEAGLSHWKILQIRPEEDEDKLKAYLESEGNRLEEQLSLLRGLRSGLRNRGSSSPLDEERLSSFECLLRERILKTILTIPDQPLPGGEPAKKIIAFSKINKYYNFKSDIIKHLRTAKIGLNLALDRYALKTDQEKVQSSDVVEYLKPCSASIEEIFVLLRESS